MDRNEGGTDTALSKRSTKNDVRRRTEWGGLLRNFLKIPMRNSFIPHVSVESKFETSHLFSRIRGKIKHQDGEEGDSHTWNDDVDGIKQGLSSECQIKNYVWIWLLAAGIIFLVSDGFRSHDVPLCRDIILLEIHPHVDTVVSAPLVYVS